MTNFAQYVLIDKPNAVGITGAWMKGVSISYSDLNRGVGTVEKIPMKELFDGRFSKDCAGGAAPEVPKAVAVMWFGKHKSRPMIEVMETDPGYWRWCVSEVSGFEKKARQAGLLEDEE